MAKESVKASRTTVLTSRTAELGYAKNKMPVEISNALKFVVK